MKPKQKFGGEWTEIKLQSLKGYLQAYAHIMKKRNYKTVYIDAFAGTGYRHDPSSRSDVNQSIPSLFDVAEESTPTAKPIPESDGSARVALQIEPPFSIYVFVEQSAVRAAELEKLRLEHPGKKILVRKEDANQYLVKVCNNNKINWKEYRAVLFLDPFGMSVKWSTLESLAKVKAFDIWYLFPLGAGANRLLMKDRSQIDAAWSKRLDDTFGTHAWHDEFYKSDSESLFSSIDGISASQAIKSTSFKKLKEFVLRRLSDLFGESCVANNPRILCNSKMSPMYLLCFATSNPNAATPAIRIAQHMLKE